MAGHDIFVESHWHNDTTVGLAVLCECGSIVLEGPEDDSQPQLSLDEINDAAWAHRDTTANAHAGAGRNQP